MSVHEGLEVKVAFGNTWKESLTELSGGQRYIYVHNVPDTNMSCLTWSMTPQPLMLIRVKCYTCTGPWLPFRSSFPCCFSNRRLCTFWTRSMLHWTCLIHKTSAKCCAHISHSHSLLWCRWRYGSEDIHNALQFVSLQMSIWLTLHNKTVQEGMFNNANVLFRVRFVDGTSTITRYAQDVDENADNTTGKRVNQKSKPLASRNRAWPLIGWLLRRKKCAPTVLWAILFYQLCIYISVQSFEQWKYFITYTV